MIQVSAFSFGLVLGLLIGALVMFVVWVMVEYHQGTYRREKLLWSDEDIREEIQREKAR